MFYRPRDRLAEWPELAPAVPAVASWAYKPAMPKAISPEHAQRACHVGHLPYIAHVCTVHDEPDEEFVRRDRARHAVDVASEHWPRHRLIAIVGRPCVIQLRPGLLTLARAGTGMLVLSGENSATGKRDWTVAGPATDLARAIAARFEGTIA